MDDWRFDHLAVVLARAEQRRTIARLLAVSLFAALPADHGGEALAKRRRKKKKPPAPLPPPPSGCTPSCFNKVCGQNDGCGGRCTVQAGCDSDESCRDGACVATCTSVCTGNHICQPNGSCTCPPGLKECEGPGYFGNCHECCVTGFDTAPHPDCIGSAGGPYCRDDDGDLVIRCSCLPGQKACGGGVCGVCCDTSNCFFDVFNDGQIVDSGRDCVVVNQQTGELGCRCRPGFSRCGNTSVCAAPGDPRLCGADCVKCGTGAVCRGNPERCCIPESGACFFGGDCCPGLTCKQQTLPPFEFVCG
jgi:hypothetical protein